MKKIFFVIALLGLLAMVIALPPPVVAG